MWAPVLKVLNGGTGGRQRQPPGSEFLQVLEQMVHGTRWLGTSRLANDPGRHAGNGLVVRHRLEHDGAGGDARAMADFDIAQNFGAGADQYATANLGMAVPRL